MGRHCDLRQIFPPPDHEGLVQKEGGYGSAGGPSHDSGGNGSPLFACAWDLLLQGLDGLQASFLTQHALFSSVNASEHFDSTTPLSIQA